MCVTRTSSGERYIESQFILHGMRPSCSAGSTLFCKSRGESRAAQSVRPARGRSHGFPCCRMAAERESGFRGEDSGKSDASPDPLQSAPQGYRSVPLSSFYHVVYVERERFSLAVARPGAAHRRFHKVSASTVAPSSWRIPLPGSWIPGYRAETAFRSFRSFAAISIDVR